ncbi:MAG: hypothetical protein MRZ61_05535 [Oscillospiraceae bacterium]|nr:hypothetical protein [Oscillospiraceae bacterium]
MAEKEYIEREAIYDKLHNIGGCDATDDWSKGWDKAIDAAINIIEAIPAADVVEVVRCKDCKHYDEEYNLCILRSEEPDPNPDSDFCECEFTTDINDFCSWGKRKENYNG